MRVPPADLAWDGQKPYNAFGAGLEEAGASYFLMHTMVSVLSASERPVLAGHLADRDPERATDPTERLAVCPGEQYRCVRSLTARVLSSLIVLAFGMSGCERENTTQAALPSGTVEPPRRVRVHTVQLENWPRMIRVQGNLLGDEISVVGTKVAGRVERVNVDIGSVVHANDELIALETKEFDLRVQQAEAQLEQARAALGLKPGDKDDSVNPLKTPLVLQEEALWKEALSKLERAKSVVATKAISVEELQQRQAAAAIAEARYRGAINDVGTQIATVSMRRAAVGLARQARDDAAVRAPFDGVVQQRHVAPGSYVQVGQTVVTLVRVDPLRFHGGIPEREAALVDLGQQVAITVEGRPEKLGGTVTRISPALDMSNRSLVIEVDIPNPDSRLRIGLFAEAEIVADPQAKTICVPVTAVREFAGVEKVWMVREGQAVEQVVQRGRRRADRVEIVQGLSVGDVVLVNARQGRAGPVVVEVSPPTSKAQ